MPSPTPGNRPEDTSGTHADTQARHEPVTGTVGENLGDMVGPYQLLSVLGSGGMGTVYLAERREPHVQRVALKIIKPGMDSRAVVARFEQERQALAVMDHPNVAKVFDAGTTPTGRPYFVMELVQGEPIHTFCDRHRLSIRDRLTLFVKVCEAVQHAHMKGVIHRDLKPGNVLVALVDGKPAPKVIDFGVSKAICLALTQKTIFTEQGQMIGTPEYMSPEQAELGAVDVDTRTDVYSLGVLLYELLSGSLPFESEALRRAGLAGILKIIREVDPPRPSTKVTEGGDRATETAERRKTRPDTLCRTLRSELEWIPLKAMRKERDRRYRSASELADDIRNYFARRPLLAGPESRAYRARKFILRNRTPVVAAALVTLALLGGIGGTTWGFVHAQRARKAESYERARAEAVNSFLVHDMLGAASPDKAKGHDISVREVMDAAAKKVGSAFRDDPVLEASVRETLGETYSQVGRYAEACEQITLAIELRSKTLGPDHAETLISRFNLGAIQVEMGDVEAAAATLRATYDARKRTLGLAADDTLRTRSLLGYVAQLAGKHEEALQIYQETLELQRRSLGDTARPTLETLSSVADVLQELGRLDEAEKISAALVDAARKAEGPDGKMTLGGLGIRAAILNDLGRYEEAESIQRAVLAARTRILGEPHPETLVTVNSLSQTLLQLEKYDEAAQLLETCWQHAVQTLGPEHASTLTYLGNLARAEQLRGRIDVAEGLMRDLLATRRRVSGEENLSTLTVMNNYALLLLERKRPGEAERLFRQMLASIAKALPETHWMRGQAEVNIGECLMEQGKYDEAEGAMLAGHERLVRSLPAGHRRIRQTARKLASLYEKWGKPEKAGEWGAKASGE